jgi:hypothetical protein
MKFGVQLEANIYEPWREKYVRYKELKDLIEAIYKRKYKDGSATKTEHEKKKQKQISKVEKKEAEKRKKSGGGDDDASDDDLIIVSVDEATRKTLMSQYQRTGTKKGHEQYKYTPSPMVSPAQSPSASPVVTRSWQQTGSSSGARTLGYGSLTQRESQAATAALQRARKVSRQHGKRERRRANREQDHVRAARRHRTTILLSPSTLYEGEEAQVHHSLQVHSAKLSASVHAAQAAHVSSVHTDDPWGDDFVLSAKVREGRVHSVESLDNVAAAAAAAAASGATSAAVSNAADKQRASPPSSASTTLPTMTSSASSSHAPSLSIDVGLANSDVSSLLMPPPPSVASSSAKDVASSEATPLLASSSPFVGVHNTRDEVAAFFREEISSEVRKVNLHYRVVEPQLIATFDSLRGEARSLSITELRGGDGRALQFQFIHLFRRCIHLMNFVALNRLAIKKITKTVDKYLRTSMKKEFSKITEQRYFTSSTLITNELIPQIYEHFADLFEHGDIAAAKSSLMAKMTKSEFSARNMFYLGVKIGLCIMLLVWNVTHLTRKDVLTFGETSTSSPPSSSSLSGAAAGVGSEHDRARRDYTATAAYIVDNDVATVRASNVNAPPTDTDTSYLPAAWLYPHTALATAHAMIDMPVRWLATARAPADDAAAGAAATVTVDGDSTRPFDDVDFERSATAPLHIDALGFYPIYSGLGLTLFFVWLWGVNVYVWTRYRISFVFIFEFNPLDRLTHWHIWEEAADLTIVFLLNALLMVTHHEYHLATTTSALVYPLSLFAWMLGKLLIPFAPFSHWKTRTCLFGAFKQLIIAPFGRSRFQECYLGDVFTSMVKIIADYEYAFCVYGSGAFLTMHGSTNVCTSIDWIVVPIICALPFFWRFNQNMRRFYDTRERFPHLANAFKYFLAQTVIVCSSFNPTLLSSDSELGAFRMVWLLVCVASSGFAYVWDIYMDWGLGRWHNKSGYPLLRDTLMYHRPSYYYAAMVADLLLRMLWLVNIIPFPFNTVLSKVVANKHLLTPILIMLELMRRCLWGFFRLENEHINNSWGFRTNDYVPIFFDTDAQKDHRSQNTEHGYGVLVQVGVMIGVLTIIIVLSAVI